MLEKIKSLNNKYLSFNEKSKVLTLTKLSIILIIILDIFVFTAINMGIDFQTKIVNNPNIKLPHNCRKIVSNSDAIKDYKYYIFHSSTSNINYNRNSYNPIMSKELDSRCTLLKEKVELIKKDKELISIKKEIEALKQRENKVEIDLKYIRDNYNTILFEKIANKESINSTLKMDSNIINAKNKFENLKTELENINKNIDNLSNKFKNDKKVEDLYQYVLSNSNIEKEYKDMMRYYKIKVSFISIIFTLPLVMFFYWRMRINNKNNRYTKYMINKNLFIVSILPLIGHLLYIFYNLIPHTFIKKIILFLYNINIPFIAYYLMIAIFVFVLTFIVIKVQNRKEKERISKINSKIDFVISYNRNSCFSCGNKVDYINMNNCPYCGNELKTKCKNCNNMLIKDLNYCHICGVENIKD